MDSRLHSRWILCSVFNRSDNVLGKKKKKKGIVMELGETMQGMNWHQTRISQLPDE